MVVLDTVMCVSSLSQTVAITVPSVTGNIVMIVITHCISMLDTTSRCILKMDHHCPWYVIARPCDVIVYAG